MNSSSKAAQRLLDALKVGKPFLSRLDAEIVSRALLSAAAERDVMRDALVKAAEQFDFYGKEHRQKAHNSRFNGIEVLAEVSDQKAETNEQFAAMCRAALSLQVTEKGE